MKKMMILMTLVIVLLTNGCGILWYTYDDTPTAGDIAYAKWKAEQVSQRETLLKEVESAEWKAKNTGTAENNKIINDSPKAKSIVGTPDDPFKEIRGMDLSPYRYNINVTTTSGGNYSNYRVTTRK